MAEKNHKRKFLLRRDVYLPWEIMESEAFKKLSAKGIFVLLRFYQKRTWTKEKRKRTEYHNNGLAFTYGEAEALGISNSQFHTVIKKLVEFGFIDIEHQGGGVARDYSRYKVSERWKSFGTLYFKHVSKSRVLWAGFDVHSRKQKLKKATENRSCQLQETVTITANNNNMGIGIP
ncbi:MAG TPA: hypothetical protein P5294_02850 [Smithellaceae bacterium]|nr:hypothetical protein [Smithellaceae bacterium]HRV25452.1 hypothetical protein [Smithellaceae bacterium]